MIISHKFRYVFVELPRTGSTAISKELREYYSGERILKKHATFRDFLRRATPEEKMYFVFASVRNPMDKLVSLYFKYKYDHRNYGDAQTLSGNNVFIRSLMRNQFRYVHDTGADFPAFFRRYYLFPYDDWSSLDHHRFNFLIRFESLADDFAEVLRRLSIEPQRPLPVINKTRDRGIDYWSYYRPGVRDRAKWVFGPYFKRWGYSFPEEWGQEVPASSEYAFRIANVARQIYWRCLR